MSKTNNSNANSTQPNSDIGAIIIDFDGTITKVPVCDAIMDKFSTKWQEIGGRHDAGDISHAELNRQFLSSLQASPDQVKQFLVSGSPYVRDGFEGFIHQAQSMNVPVFIVSGGWDMYISEILQAETNIGNISFLDRMEDFSPSSLNVITNSVIHDGNEWKITSPFPASFLSSPCKKTVVANIRKLVNGKIMFIGDGSTDFEGAEAADVVFARDGLANYCDHNAIPFSPYSDFKEIKERFLGFEFEFAQYPAVLEMMKRKFFLDPTGKNLGYVQKVFSSSIAATLDAQGDGPLYPRFKSEPTPRESVQEAFLNANVERFPDKFLQSAIPMGLQGGVKGGNPLMVKNIIPTPSTIFLTTLFTASVYAQNGVTGEDAAEAANSELKMAAIMSEIAGFDRNEAAGLFTFGGTATNMYGIKMGLAKCYPNQDKQGVFERTFVIGSKSAHYSHVTSVDWLGIGQNAYVHAETNIDQSTNLIDMEEKCRKLLDSGAKLVCIIGSGGTTSNMGIDDFSEIKAMRDRLVSDYNLQYLPHIHADSVIGWPYLFYKNYDFKENKLGFSEEAVDRLHQAFDRISTIRHADSFGVDFHKTGYMPYNSSMIICKNKKDLQVLGRNVDLMAPLFHDDKVYNPGKVSLETSRSSAVMLATWLTLQSFGSEGYQVLLGHAQEMAIQARKELSQHEDKGLYIVNHEGYGSDIFVRCCMPGADVNQEYLNDLSDDSRLTANSDYTSRFFKWFSQENQEHRKHISFSKTSAAFYTESGLPVVALRLYILSPYTTPEAVKKLVGHLVEAKQEYDVSWMSNNKSDPKKALELR